MRLGSVQSQAMRMKARVSARPAVLIVVTLLSFVNVCTVQVSPDLYSETTLRPSVLRCIRM